MSKRIVSRKRIGGEDSLYTKITFSDGTSEYRYKKEVLL